MAAVTVIFSQDLRTWEQRTVNLHDYTLDQEFGEKLTFCYYQETSLITVFAGMKSLRNTFYVFTKLVENEPVDLEIDEWLSQWRSNS